MGDEHSMQPKARRLVYCVTSGLSADKLLKGQLHWFRHRGWDVHLVCSPHPSLEAVAAREGAHIHCVDMRRDPAPLADLKALVKLIVLFRKLRPDVLNYGTPKAALLAAIA